MDDPAWICAAVVAALAGAIAALRARRRKRTRRGGEAALLEALGRAERARLELRRTLHAARSETDENPPERRT